ncbi:MAG: long-chain-fatty-acid--CoA ligase [Helicobacteraceae bacterium]|nr:long-chain-fatty-acid--CoA ligase [Helicobacteraceae bacterium]
MTYPFNNFYEMLENSAKEHGSAPAIFIDDDKVSYKEFLQKVDKTASYLQNIGIKKGDKVALILPNCEEFVITTFATTAIGAVIVPLNAQLKTKEYEYILQNAQVRLLVTSQKLKEIKELKSEFKIYVDGEEGALFANILNTNEIKFEKHLTKLDELAVLIYTSGTTGKPKGVMLSYKNIFSNIIAGSELFQLSKKDRFIVYLPMSHAFSFSIMVMLPFYKASAIVIMRSILPFSNIIKQVLLKRVTIFLGVPDVYNSLIKAKLPWYFRWFNSIRIFISGASALSEDTLERFKKKFSHASMLEGYGLSECSPAVAINPLNKARALSVGLPLGETEVKVVNDELVELAHGEAGELIVKGDCVMMGYYGHEESTKETIINGWLKTGDIAKVDEDGYIYIVDRIKDLIISKGVNIYPREIEEVLHLHEQIKISAVLGKSDQNSGEVPVAFVELEDGSTLSELEIKKYLKEHLANFKVPKSIIFKDELPKNATGKVLKRVLKEEAQL